MAGRSAGLRVFVVSIVLASAAAALDEVGLAGERAVGAEGEHGAGGAAGGAIEASGPCLHQRGGVGEGAQRSAFEVATSHLTGGREVEDSKKGKERKGKGG